jgi:hypothetical protein
MLTLLTLLSLAGAYFWVSKFVFWINADISLAVMNRNMGIKFFNFTALEIGHLEEPSNFIVTASGRVPKA